MASAKGGSGKTILTATFGALLVALGKKVLLIDTDAATNGLTLLYLPEVMQGAELALSKGIPSIGVYEVTPTNSDPLKVELKNGVSLVPAGYNFRNTESASLEHYESFLSSYLRDAREAYDFIFLDAQAGSDQFAQVAMGRSVSDEVVIVSEYDPLSAAGVERLKGLFREDLTYDRTWILLNKMLPEFVKSFSDFMEVARYLSPIPWNAEIVKAYSRRRLALDMERGNEFTLAVIQTLRTMLGDQIESEIKYWRDSRTALAVAPIERQESDLFRELDAVIDIRKKKLRQRKRRLMIEYGVGMLSVTALLTNFGMLTEKGGSQFQLIQVALLGAVVIFFVTRGLNKQVFEHDELEERERVLMARIDQLGALKDAGLEALVRER